MMLRAVGPRPWKPALEHAQPVNLVDVEPLPSARRPASAVAGQLKAQQTLDAALHAVVVRLDDARSSEAVDELDQALVTNCADKILIHGAAQRSSHMRLPRAFCFTMRHPSRGTGCHAPVGCAATA